MVEGIPEGDLTRGYIDGFARFIDADTVVVSQCTQTSSCRPGDGSTGSVYDAAAKKRIEGYFPGRDVYVIEMLASWYDGGGVHCHTNDQPEL